MTTVRQTNRTALSLVAGLSLVLALVYAPLLIGLGRVSLNLSQLSTGAVLILVMCVLGVRDALAVGRPTPRLQAHGAMLLAWVLICLGLTGLLVRWVVPLVLLSFCLAVAAIVSFVFGKEGVRGFLPAIGAVFVFGLLAWLSPSLDWPLRAVAGRQAAEVLAMLHQPVQLGLVPGKPAELILQVPGQTFVVATECNGFGLLTSALLVATILAFQERLPWLSKLGLLTLAGIIAIVANFLRIVVISLLAPRLPVPYLLLHEVVGLILYLAGLALVWRVATVNRARVPAHG
jgi:exosortase/archaeosortase family protein